MIPDTRRLAADEPGITAAATLLAAGGLVAFPTETVFGLGGDATNPKAVAAIYAAKGRPSFNPLIAHVPTCDAALALGRFNSEATALARAFWPGPLTLVVPALPDGPVCDLARAGLATLAIRVPSHPIARRLLERVARPIAAPSANRSGHVSPTSALHVLDDLDGRIAAVLEDDASTVGRESTILACLDGRVTLLRPGAITRADVARVLGAPPESPDKDADANPLAPGRLASHYAPRARLRLDVTAPQPDEAFLGFGPLPANATGMPHLSLSLSGDLTEAAANLYAALRQLDATGIASIAVAPIPAEGLGEAIRDRLMRAAAPRGV